MPSYRVLIEGSGFEFAGDDGAVIRGFVVVRLASATSESEATSTAINRVSEEWARGKYAFHKVCPLLVASEVERLSLLGRFGARETGYVFHPGTCANG